MPGQRITKGIIVYQSKYGATKKYVEWLQVMTDYPCVETSKATINEVAQYDAIVLCGGIYASGISGLSFLLTKLYAECCRNLWQKKTRIHTNRG